MIALIDYGAGNLRSIQNAFAKIGVGVEVASTAQAISRADALVLPGVGNFGDAMKKLAPLKKEIVSSVESGRPFLGLCLGIQVILGESAESPKVHGLELINGCCRRFDGGGLKVPHMGWNTIEVVKKTPLLAGIESGEFFYFVHSYYPVPKDKSAVAAETNYGIKFASVISRDNIHATQFHPEKSGDAGLRVLANFAGLL